MALAMNGITLRRSGRFAHTPAGWRRMMTNRRRLRRCETSELNTFTNLLTARMAQATLEVDEGEGHTSQKPLPSLSMPVMGDDRIALMAPGESAMVERTAPLPPQLRGRFWRNFAVYLLAAKRVLTRLGLKGPTDTFFMGKIRQGELANVLAVSRMTFAEPRVAEKNSGEIFRDLVAATAAGKVGAAFIECYVGYYSGAGWVAVVMADTKFLPSLGPLWGRCGPYTSRCVKAAEYTGLDPLATFGEVGYRHHYLTLDTSQCSELEVLRPQVSDDIFDGIMLFNHRWTEVMESSQDWLAPLYHGVADGVRNFRRAWHKLEESWAGYNVWELELAQARSIMEERFVWERESGTRCVWYERAYTHQLMEADR